MSDDTAITAEQKITECAPKLGLSITCEFVPFSQSRNAAAPELSLNWKVRLWHLPASGVARVPVLTTDYQQDER